MKGLIVSAMLAMMALSVGTAQAADPPVSGAKAQARTQKIFPKVDRDKDGFITVEEWVAHGYKFEKFAIVDTDRNGKITINEFLVAQAFCDLCFR